MYGHRKVGNWAWHDCDDDLERIKKRPAKKKMGAAAIAAMGNSWPIKDLGLQYTDGAGRPLGGVLENGNFILRGIFGGRQIQEIDTLLTWSLVNEGFLFFLGGALGLQTFQQSSQGIELEGIEDISRCFG